MGKKHFWGLADKLRDLRPKLANTRSGWDSDCREDLEEYDLSQARLAQWELMVSGIADYLTTQSPTFNRVDWINYIKVSLGRRTND